MIVEDGKVNENLKFFLLALVGVVMIIWLAYAITVIISVVIG
jgi:succinate dehydrogenase hydrophobic anchor subunit